MAQSDWDRFMADDGGVQQHKTPETKKRAAEDTPADGCYTEKRVKANCWERSQDEHVEAVWETQRAQSIWYQRFMAASNRVADYLAGLSTKEHWSRLSRQAADAAKNGFETLRFWCGGRRPRRRRRFFTPRGGYRNVMKTKKRF
jgi:hypothetical protein